MLFDDGMEVEDLESLDASKDHVTLSDLMDALETKYDLLREKLLLEMAHLSSGLCQQFVVYLLNLVNLSESNCNKPINYCQLIVFLL